MEKVDNILRDIFDKKIVAVVEVLLKDPSRKYTLIEISRESNVNITTCFRIINKLVRKDIINLIKVEKTKYYQIKQSESTRILSSLFSAQNQE